MSSRSCFTCKYADCGAYNEPCINCLSRVKDDIIFAEWEPEE